MAYSKLSRVPGMLGATADASSPATSLKEALTSDTAKTAAEIALIFHGYKRTGSILWALLYGMAGRYVPVVAVPVALAQGFGSKRTCP